MKPRHSNSRTPIVSTWMLEYPPGQYFRPLAILGESEPGRLQRKCQLVLSRRSPLVGTLRYLMTSVRVRSAARRARTVVRVSWPCCQLPGLLFARPPGSVHVICSRVVDAASDGALVRVPQGFQVHVRSPVAQPMCRADCRASGRCWACPSADRPTLRAVRATVRQRSIRCSCAKGAATR
jgi:hypothetical protein